MRVPQVSDRLKEVPAQALRGVFAGIGQLLLITDKLRNKTPAGTGVPRARTPGQPEAVPKESVTVTDTAADGVPGAPEAAEPVAPEAPEASKTSGARKASGAPQASGARKAGGAPKASETAKASGAPQASETPQTSAATQVSAAAETVKTPRVPKARDFDKTGNVRLLGGADAAARTAGKTAKAGKADADTAAEASAPAKADSAADTSPAGEPSPAAGAGPVMAAAQEPGDSGAPLPNFDELSVPSLRARLRNLDIGQVRQMLEYERTHAARPEVIAMFERRIAKLEAEA